MLGVVLAAAAALAQTPQRPAQSQAPQRFQATTRLVVETVTVTDAAGRPVEGLTSRDFRISEDKLPQTVAFCDYQKIDDAAAARAESSAAARPRADAAGGRRAGGGIAPAGPGSARYAGRRLLVLYFDMASMQVAEQLRALQAAERFVAWDMKPADMLAVLNYNGAAVKVGQGFTSDRDALQAALSRLVVGTGMGLSQEEQDAASGDYGSAFGQDNSEFNVFNTNRQLAALQTAVDMLAPLNEKKALVYFASGITLNGVNNQAQLTSLTNAAIKANVALYPVDARGLTASAPLGDASQGSPGGIGMYNGAAALALANRLARTQNTLFALGADTGGKAMLDSNNLAAGIEAARDAIRGYYVLGYYTTHAQLDGSYRRIQVSLAFPAARGEKLAYRTGYYAGKVFAKFTSADKERQLEDALRLPNPITDLNMDLELNYFQIDSAEYFVPVSAKIPGSELVLAKRGGAAASAMDFIGEVKDAYGYTITNMRDQVKMKLNSRTAAQLARLPIEFNTGFTVLPGTYTLKLLARDNETGRIGTYIKTFTIPNLMQMAGQLPLSSVVLGDTRVALAAALFNAKANAGKNPMEKGNPLVENGEELLPSVVRVFRQDRPMYVFLQAYEHLPAPGAAAAAAPGVLPETALMQPLEAYVGVYQGGQRVYQTPTQNIVTGRTGRAGGIPIRFTLGLGSLAPGSYIVQVTVLDPAAHLAGYWHGSILLARARAVLPAGKTGAKANRGGRNSAGAVAPVARLRPREANSARPRPAVKQRSAAVGRGAPKPA